MEEDDAPYYPNAGRYYDAFQFNRVRDPFEYLNRPSGPIRHVNFVLPVRGFNLPEYYDDDGIAAVRKLRRPSESAKPAENLCQD